MAGLGFAGTAGIVALAVGTVCLASGCSTVGYYAAKREAGGAMDG